MGAQGLTRLREGRAVLDDLTFDARPGDRIGVIGENGAGKSTLLRILAGLEDADEGSVLVPADVGTLHQELPYPPEATVGAVVEDALAGARRILADLDAAATDLAEGNAGAEHRYTEALDAAEAENVWDAERHADLVLSGLGLDPTDPGRTVGTLSGGQRARLGLAALLVRRPSALLLDEPTNHLDDSAVDFLIDELKRMRGAVVVAGHDRYLLDEICTGILDLDPSRGGATFYGGDYRHYLREREIELQAWRYRYRTEQEELRSLRHSVDVTSRQVGHHRPIRDNNKMSFGLIGNRVEQQISRRIRAATGRLEDLTERQVAPPPEPLRLDAVLTTAPGEDGIALRAIDVGVRNRLRPTSLRISRTGRLLITGGNGCGKSTLLTVLQGDLEPTAGVLERGPGIRTGLLRQDVDLDRSASSRQLYDAAGGAGSARPLVDLGLIAERDLDRPVGVLSIGQQRRVALALLIAVAPDVLLLDEPTNHLSPALADDLEEALGAAPGAIVVASHDRWLRRRWSGEELALT
ncbi:ATP-binding cassette domain-containing protein [Nakamurella sp. YIM 132087]|uniref:ATP-binding cassette domain-containing protein n=1 Tax=Nakamurella alba TaxID=2665158 RepID=A0A7K1FMR4_9ACTN|nr:ATP-binding cassette domain-containing protein [Nakamurella alba]